MSSLHDALKWNLPTLTHVRWVLENCSPCVYDSASLLSDEERDVIMRLLEGGAFDDIRFTNYLSVSVSERVSAFLGRAIPPEAFWRSLDRKGWVEGFYQKLAYRGGLAIP